jgi:Subtilase family
VIGLLGLLGAGCSTAGNSGAGSGGRPALPLGDASVAPRPGPGSAPAGAADSPPRVGAGSPSGAAAAPEAPQRVMVTLPPAPLPIWTQITLDLERTYRLRTVYAWSMQSLGERCIVFEAPPGRSVETLLRRLASDPRVGLVQPLQRFTTQDSHTLGRRVPLQHSAQALRLAQAHQWATGRGVRIAVIDTGVDVDHPELRGRIAKIGNFVEPGAPGVTSSLGDRSFNTDIHGTAVTGVIAAALNLEMGLVGVAPQAQVYALKACWQERPGAREAVCDSYTLAKAIDFALLQGAQVLNFSLAGPPDPLLAKLVAAALTRGVVVVAADGPDAARSFPATQPGVLAVAGSDDLQGGLRFPMRQPAAGTLAAPGVDILTTVPHGHYDFFSGSSFAAAQVSGVVALLLEREPRLTPQQVAALFHRTAHPILVTPGDRSASVDQIDACAALAASLGGTGGCS